MKDYTNIETYVRNKRYLKYNTVICLISLVVSLTISKPDLIAIIADRALTIFSSLILGQCLSYWYGGYWWKNRVKKYETACEEYSTNVTYHASLLGLEPVNLIVFKKKIQSPK